MENLEPEELTETLQALEMKLQDPAVRGDRQLLGELLHPLFEEVGRSGTRYSRREVVEGLLAEGNVGSRRFLSKGFKTSCLAENLTLLTYQSAETNAAGRLERQAVRSSIWVREGSHWKLRFHQATPTSI